MLLLLLLLAVLPPATRGELAGRAAAAVEAEAAALLEAPADVDASVDGLGLGLSGWRAAGCGSAGGSGPRCGPRGRHKSHSQPFSFIMCASSMMYLPSLYFWLDSNASSYFQPSVVLQHSQ